MPPRSNCGLRKLPARGLAIIIALAAIGGCSDGVPEFSSLTSGTWYHAHLRGGEPEAIPFFLHLPDDCDTAPATIANGEERLAAPCARGDRGVRIEFPIYSTAIEADLAPDGGLSGTWYRELPERREEIMAFAAKKIEEPDPRLRFPAVSAEPADRMAPAPVAAAAVDVSGIWRIEFNVYGIAKGVFDQRPDGVVTGSIEVPAEYGDLRFLAGNVIDDTLLLSTFDGQQASYIEGAASDDGAMDGVWIFATYWDEFTAARAGDFEVVDPLGGVRYLPGSARLDLPALRDPKYDDKPVIVQIFGTWCPNCSDHAPVLAELYRAHREEGLQILGIAFEATDDDAFNEQRVQLFRERHGVDWEVVIADTRLEDVARNGLAGLSPIEGIPVTVFLDRDHSVHAVYTGFAGPAARAAHERAIERFRRLTREILDDR